MSTPMRDARHRPDPQPETLGRVCDWDVACCARVWVCHHGIFDHEKHFFHEKPFETLTRSWLAAQAMCPIGPTHLKTTCAGQEGGAGDFWIPGEVQQSCRSHSHAAGASEPPARTRTVCFRSHRGLFVCACAPIHRAVHGCPLAAAVRWGFGHVGPG